MSSFGTRFDRRSNKSVQPSRGVMKYFLGHGFGPWVGVSSLCVALALSGCGTPSATTEGPEPAADATTSTTTEATPTSDSNRISMGTTLNVNTLDPADAYDYSPRDLVV